MRQYAEWDVHKRKQCEEFRVAPETGAFQYREYGDADWTTVFSLPFIRGLESDAKEWGMKYGIEVGRRIWERMSQKEQSECARYGTYGMPLEEDEDFYSSPVQERARQELFLQNRHPECQAWCDDWAKVALDPTGWLGDIIWEAAEDAALRYVDSCAAELRAAWLGDDGEAQE